MMVFKSISKNRQLAVESYDIDHDGLAFAMHESFCEFEKFRGELPVAMSNIYESVALEQSKPLEDRLAVMEGAISEGWQRIKNWFVKIGEKIRAWFDNVVKFFKSIFLSNKKFIDKYSSELKGKDISKFTYSGHQWNESKMDEWAKKVEGCRSLAEGAFKDAVATAAKTTDVKATESGYKISEKKKEIDKKLGVNGISQFKEKMVRETRGGEKRDITGFKVKSVEAMIAFVTDEADVVKDLQETANDIKDASAKYADEVDTAMGKYKDDENDHGKRASIATYLGHAAEVARYHISYETAALETKKSLLHAMVSEFSGALRSFARYSPKKESYLPGGFNDIVNEGASLIDTFAADA